MADIVRVVLAVRPLLLRDLVEGVLALDPVIRVVARTSDEQGAVQATLRTRPDALVIAPAGPAPGRAVQALLLHLPRLRIVALGADGHHAAVLELCLHTRHLPAWASADLLQALRLPPPLFGG